MAKTSVNYGTLQITGDIQSVFLYHLLLLIFPHN